ncbi:hypothetical protein ACHAXS_001920 [Conticribra weissflogii]
MHVKETPHHSSLPRASVLVPLFERPSSSSSSSSSSSFSSSNSSSIHVLFTQRPSTLSSHPGEVCFPGGRQDPSDRSDDVLTALREAREEIGLSPDVVRIVARMEARESKHGLCVTPIVGWVDRPDDVEPGRLKVNDREVDVAFAVPLEVFAGGGSDGSSGSGSGSSSRNEDETKSYFWEEAEAENDTSKRTFRIWGLTARVACEVAEAALAAQS